MHSLHVREEEQGEEEKEEEESVVRDPDGEEHTRVKKKDKFKSNGKPISETATPKVMLCDMDFTARKIVAPSSKLSKHNTKPVKEGKSKSVLTHKEKPRPSSSKPHSDKSKLPTSMRDGERSSTGTNKPSPFYASSSSIVSSSSSESKRMNSHSNSTHRPLDETSQTKPFENSPKAATKAPKPVPPKTGLVQDWFSAQLESQVKKRKVVTQRPTTSATSSSSSHSLPHKNHSSKDSPSLSSSVQNKDTVLAAKFPHKRKQLISADAATSSHTLSPSPLKQPRLSPTLDIGHHSNRLHTNHSIHRRQLT